MVTQAEMLYQHVIEEFSREQLKEIHDTPMDRIRGTLSKAWDNPKAVEHILETAIKDYKGQSSYRLAQQNIIDKARNELHQHREILRERGGSYLAVFASDKHLPYIRTDAFMLELQILDDIGKAVAYYSGLNDLYDFGIFGKWVDEPNEEVSMWTSDIQYLLRLSGIIYKAVQRKAPYAKILGITGNHDKRILQHFRKEMDGYSEKRVLEFMQELEAQGLLWLTNSSKVEPIITLSDGLKWAHGVSASKLDNTVSKNTIEKAQGRPETNDEGVLYHTVSGHLHRSFKGNYMGVTHANSGCGCHLTPAYMTHEPQWNLGIVISEFDASGRGVYSTVVDFKQEGNALTAVYNGKKYQVEAKPDRFINY